MASQSSPGVDALLAVAALLRNVGYPLHHCFLITLILGHLRLQCRPLKLGPDSCSFDSLLHRRILIRGLHGSPLLRTPLSRTPALLLRRPRPFLRFGT